MTSSETAALARQMWAGLAGVPVAFDAGVQVVTAPDSQLCPPGFVGVVTIGGAALLTAPDEPLAAALRRHVARRPVAELTDAATFAPAFTVDAVLGPARLAYATSVTLRPTADPLTTRPVEGLAPDHPGVAALLASVDPQDADECGLSGITSPAFVERDGALDVRAAGGDVVAAAGYVVWPGDTAHLCVLTAAHARGRGAHASSPRSGWPVRSASPTSGLS